MNKISSADLLKQASMMLRNLVKERDDLTVKVAQLSEKLSAYEQQERVLQLAEKLASRGPYTGLPLNERVNFVQAKLAEGLGLSELEHAIDMLAPDGSIGKVAGDNRPLSVVDAVEQYYG